MGKKCVVLDTADICPPPAWSWATPQPHHNSPPESSGKLRSSMPCALAKLSVLELHLAAPFRHTFCYSILGARGHGQI